MQFKKKLDVYSIQIIAQYLKFKSDFLNIIQVRKQFQYVLDRFRINPIPITNDTKNLFQCLDTQQFFWIQSLTKDTNWELSDYEIELPNTKILQYSFDLPYSKYLEIKNNTSKLIKCPALTYTKEDRKIYGNTIPEGIKVLGNLCFYKSEIKQIMIPESVTRIKDRCFEDCGELELIYIPDNVISIGKECFAYCCELSSVHLSTNITKLKQRIFFQNHSLKNINIPPYLKEMNKQCFRGCLVSNIELPKSTTKIDCHCFECCILLKSIDLRGIKFIGLGRNEKCIVWSSFIENVNRFAKKYSCYNPRKFMGL